MRWTRRPDPNRADNALVLSRTPSRHDDGDVRGGGALLGPIDPSHDSHRFGTVRPFAWLHPLVRSIQNERGSAYPMVARQPFAQNDLLSQRDLRRFVTRVLVRGNLQMLASDRHSLARQCGAHS
ncbi:MAG: hypothetical protein R2832_18070 [Rhodothermales bacterium]